MGLLKSVKDNHALDFYEYRDTYYWNKYKYRIRISAKGVRFVYYAKNIDQFIYRVNTFKDRYDYIKYSGVEKQFIIDNKDNFKKLIDFKLKFAKEKLGSVRIEGDTIAFFCNDLSLLNDMKTEINNSNFQKNITEVQLSIFSGTKYFIRKPKYKFRVHLRTMTVPLNTVDDLVSFLNRYKDVRPSPGLKRWLNPNNPTWVRKYSSSSYSIDYNDESMITLIMLIFGDIISKKFVLAKRPD